MTNTERFMELFSGLDTAFGTGRGEWVKRPPRRDDFSNHLNGMGPGIGIAPLRPDSKVLFAAIDLDEPDFEAAREMQTYIPGTSFIERTRSGNAHVWVFFTEPIEAWVPMGILKEACLATGKKHVEVFPKNHDFARVTLGNYINLPFHGNERPMLRWASTPPTAEPAEVGPIPLGIDAFLDAAEASKNDPRDWRRKATWLMLDSPNERKDRAEFGTQPRLHICGKALIEGDTPPPAPGHRASVYFALAKQLTNWTDCDHNEALEFMRSVNERASDSVPDSELVRILGNAERGQFTSTGCDDPLFAPYALPECPIANPRR